MQAICWLSVATSLSLAFITPVYGQVLGSSGSLAEQFIRLDRNGDGRIDEAERASMQPTEQEQSIDESVFPLICESQALGFGGGSGSSSSNRRDSNSQHRQAGLARHQEVRLAESQEPSESESVELREGAPRDVSVDGYPHPEDTEVEPQLPPRSMGLSKAVQYRLLQNARQSRPRPLQYRQAAVFGATQGLVKREPTRYQPVAHIDCCAPSRSVYQLQFYARRN